MVFLRFDLMTTFWSIMTQFKTGPRFHDDNPSWPSLKLVQDFMMTNILTKFHADWIKTIPTRVYILFFKTWPNDLVFDPTWPTFKLVLFSWWQTFWHRFMTIGSNLYLPECIHGFLKFDLVTYFLNHCDLVSNLTYLYFMEINILTEFHLVWIKTVPFRVYTSFFYKIWLSDLIFNPTIPSFKYRPD